MPIRYIHDGMIHYLMPNKSRLELVKEMLNYTIQATTVAYLANDHLNDLFLSDWVDCAVHEECIAPKGSTKDSCINSRPIQQYIGCHRYDQAALNLILYRELGSSVASLYHKEVDKLLSIDKSPTYQYDNSRSHSCNILYRA